MISSIRRQRLSTRHTKGILTITLLLLAETVTFVNAKSFWNRITGDRQHKPHHYNQHNKNDNKKIKEETSATSGDSSCPEPVALQVSRLFPRHRLAQQQQQQQQQQPLQNAVRRVLSPQDCCRDCAHMMDPTQAWKSCPDHAMLQTRGGGLFSSYTAEAVGEAVAGAESVAAHHHMTPYGLPLNFWKVFFQAILTAINVICWLVPLRSKKISENKLALSLANAFSGGVFLSLAFGHLIPECIHGFDGTDWPETAPYLFVLTGYLLIFFVEKVAFDAHGALHEMEHMSDPQQQQPLLSPKSQQQTQANGGTALSEVATIPKPSAPTTQDSSASISSAVSTSSNGKSGRKSAVILLGALAVHSMLEMMALGLSDRFGDSALLTLSIALHQPAESIALLVAFLKSGMPKGLILRYLSVFSCMGPIGVALGMAVNEYAAPIVDSIMLAIVAGTFVYVGATEVIPEEWEDGTHKWAKFGSLMAGIVSILFITSYTMSLETQA